MRTYDVLLTGLSETRLIIDYKFFLILNDGGFPLDVQVWKKNGYQKCQGISAGFGLKLSEDSRGKEFIFSSANAQTIKIFAGDDEAMYNRLSGNVTINGIVSVMNQGGIVNTIEDGVTYGASSKSVANLIGSTPVTVFTPAANINGALLHTAMIYSFITSAANPSVSLIAKSSTPGNITDGDVLLLFAGFNGFSSSPVTLEKTLKIDAGKGLYFYSSQNETNGARSALYTLK